MVIQLISCCQILEKKTMRLPLSTILNLHTYCGQGFLALILALKENKVALRYSETRSSNFYLKHS